MMVIIYISLLNLLWFSCVLGAANQLLWPGALMLAVLLSVAFIYQGFNAIDRKIIACSLVGGLLIDGFLAQQSTLSYANTIHQFSFLPPIWIMFLWLGFGATVRVGLQWLLQHPVIGGVIMLVGAPLSYFSASKLGAVVINDLWHASMFIGVSWLIYFIVLVQISQNSEGRKNVVA